MTRPPLVLLVEDDDSNREMYSLFLESEGYWVLEARNGTEGLIKSRNFQPQVVVTDISMPGMDGWEFARALRENDRTSNICIIAVTGRDPDAPPAKAQQHVDIVLKKPCLPEELLREIRKLLAYSQLTRIQGRRQVAKARSLRARSEELLKRSEKHHRRE